MTAQAIWQEARTGIARRLLPIGLALALLLLGVCPGPSLLLVYSDAWSGDAAVKHLADEQAFWLSGLLLIILPAIVFANLVPRAFDRIAGTVRRRVASMPDRWLVLAIVLFAVLAAAAASIYVVSQKPTTSDEVAQLWHARTLLTGRLYLPVDPNPEFFAVDNMIDRGRWYSQFPIGGPLVLSLGLLFKAAWLLNPLLAGLLVLNVYRFAAAVYDRQTAIASAVLCATCPFMLLMSGSYMNHTVVAFLATLALAELPAVLDGTPRRRMVAAIVVGFALGAAIAVRPLDGAIAAATLGIVVLGAAVRRARVREVVVAVAAGLVPIAALLAVNSATTGAPFLFGYEVLWGANHSLGFHADPSGNPHTPARALALAALYVMQLNWSLFEWPVAGLLIVAGALVIGKLKRWDLVLVAWISLQLIAYAAYWHAGNFMGPRYLFTVVPACLLIVGRGLTVVLNVDSSPLRRALTAGLAASILAAWLIPMAPVGALGSAKALRGTRAAFKWDLEAALAPIAGRKALVFLGETASSRLMRRMWGLGLSWPDAARLAATKDNCALLEALLTEEQSQGSIPERLARLDRTKSYAPPQGWRLMVPDMAFRTSDRESITPRCQSELLMDRDRGVAFSYGQALLMNTIGPDGHIAGPIVLVADIAEHNEVLRGRYSDRPWYRMAVKAGPRGPVPQLVPYDSTVSFGLADAR